MQASVYVPNTNLLQIVKLFSILATYSIAPLWDVTDHFYLIVFKVFTVPFKKYAFLCALCTAVFG